MFRLLNAVFVVLALAPRAASYSAPSGKKLTAVLPGADPNRRLRPLS